MCMAREEWHSLYTDAVETIWREERAELKKTAMLIHILGLELSRVKDLAEKELIIRRKQFILLDNYKTEKVTPKVNHTSSGSNVVLTPLIIPKVENITESYISPDLFRNDSPDFSTNSNTTNPNVSNIDESNIILSPTNRSPKINRSRNLFNIKKSRVTKSNKTSDNNNDIFKFPIAKKKEITPIRGTDEIIQGTPEPKKSKISKLSMHRSPKKLKQTKLNNTLTQMFPQIMRTPKDCEKLEDTDATYCHVTQKGENKVEDIVDMIGKDTKNKQDDKLKRFNHFVYNYDEVPDRDKPINTVEDKKRNCKKCTKYGIKCPQHKILSESYNKTYSGFWDVDFTVDDPNEDSDESTIFGY